MHEQEQEKGVKQSGEERGMNKYKGGRSKTRYKKIMKKP